MLINQEAADSLDERLNFALDRVLMLMSRCGWEDPDLVFLEESMGDVGCVLCGPGVAADGVDAVAVSGVEEYHLRGCGEKGVRRFCVGHYGVSVGAERVPEEEETGVVTC
jgi:hypothetical protein